jgi:hypothetical protein
MKILSVAAELSHLDGRVDTRTDMTQLKVAFRNFAKASNGHKNGTLKNLKIIKIIHFYI